MIVELHLHVPAYWYPGWHPGIGGTRDQFRFLASDGYTITRDGAVYVIERDHGGELHRCEVPVSHAKCAVYVPEQQKAQPVALKAGRK